MRIDPSDLAFAVSGAVVANIWHWTLAVSRRAGRRGSSFAAAAAPKLAARAAKKDRKVPDVTEVA